MASESPGADKRAHSAKYVVNAYGVQGMQIGDHNVQHNFLAGDYAVPSADDRVEASCQQESARDIERAAGGLHLAGQITDRAFLGIHPAIPLPEGADPSLSPDFPSYVTRDIDADLRNWITAHLHTGGFLLLVGPAAAGKTRCAYELIRESLPEWPIFMPSTADQLAAYAGADPHPSKLLVWLNDTHNFLGPAGLTPITIRRLLARPYPVIIIGTTWPRYYDAFTACAKATKASTLNQHDRDAEITDPNRGSREILTVLAHRYDLPAAFSQSEHQHARSLAPHDPRIAEALTHTDTPNIAETLAAAPDLKSRWLTTDNPFGAAVITAAATARRCGHPEPLPATVIKGLAQAALTPAQRAEIGSKWFSASLEWARQPVRGKAAPLTPQATTPGRIDGDHVSDVLVQHANQHSAAPWHDIPEPIWLTLIALATAQACRHIADTRQPQRNSDLSPITETALRKAVATGESIDTLNLGLFLHKRSSAEAELLYRKAADDGNIQAMHNLGDLLNERGDAATAGQWWRRAAESGDSRSMDHLGNFFNKRGEFAEAEHWWRKAADAGDIGALYDLGKLFHERNNITEAELWWHKIAQSESAYAMHLYGDMLDKIRGQTAQAEHWWHKAADKGNADAMFHLGNLSRDRGDTTKAEQWWRKAADLGDTSAMHHLADLLDEQADAAEAERWWRRAAEAGESNAMCHLALLLKKRGNTAEAERWWRKAADLGDTTAMGGLGFLFFEREDAAGAEQWWRKGADKGDTLIMTFLASLLDRRGDVAEAERWWRHAAEAGESAAMSHLAILLRKRGDAAGAEQWWRKAADKGDANAMINLASLLDEEGDAAGAEQWWRKAADKGDANAMINLASLLDEEGDAAGAEQWWRKAADKGDANAMTLLGILLFQRGDADEAEQWSRKAADKGDANAMTLLGILLFQRGDADEAEQWLHRTADQGSVTAMHHLGDLFFGRGDTAEAEQWWRHAAEAGESAAMSHLAILLRKRGDAAGAEHWCRGAADQGNVTAMHHLADLLDEQGDAAGAGQWRRKAAEMRHQNHDVSREPDSLRNVDTP